MLNWLRTFTADRSRSISERKLAQKVVSLEGQIERAELDVGAEREKHADQVEILQEQLEAERVQNRIQKLEIEKLMAVCARDLERVRSENEKFRPGKQVDENGVDLLNRITG